MPQVRLLNLTSLYQLLTLAVLSLGSLFVWRDGALSVLFGGGFGATNFYALRAIASRALRGDQRDRLLYGLALALKMVTTLGVMAALLFVLKLDILGFAVGLGTMFAGLFLALAHLTLTRSSAHKVD